MGLAAALTERVALGCADEGARAGCVEPGHEVAATPDDGRRSVARLAFHELRGGSELVGDRGGGHRERPPVAVEAAGEFLHDDDSRGADRRIRLTFTPRATE